MGLLLFIQRHGNAPGSACRRSRPPRCFGACQSPRYSTRSYFWTILTTGNPTRQPSLSLSSPESQPIWQIFWGVYFFFFFHLRQYAISDKAKFCPTQMRGPPLNGNVLPRPRGPPLSPLRREQPPGPRTPPGYRSARRCIASALYVQHRVPPGSVVSRSAVRMLYGTAGYSRSVSLGVWRRYDIAFRSAYVGAPPRRRAPRCPAPRPRRRAYFGGYRQSSYMDGPRQRRGRRVAAREQHRDDLVPQHVEWAWRSLVRLRWCRGRETLTRCTSSASEVFAPRRRHSRTRSGDCRC